IGRIGILNATGKIVWDLLSAGHGPKEVASIFARHFSLPIEQANKDVGDIICRLDDACFFSSSKKIETAYKPDFSHIVPTEVAAPPVCAAAICGTFQFNNT